MNLTDTIAMLQGFLWLANYDPTDYYPLGPEIVEETKHISFEEEYNSGPTLYNILFDRDNLYDKRLNYDIAS